MKWFENLSGSGLKRFKSVPDTTKSTKFFITLVLIIVELRQIFNTKFIDSCKKYKVLKKVNRYSKVDILNVSNLKGLGTTSLLILVGVTIDTTREVRSVILSNIYKDMVKSK